MVKLVRDLRDRKKKIKVISLLNDVIHSRISGVFPAVFKAGHGGVFSYCSFFGTPLNETTDMSEGRRLLVSSYYVHCARHPKTKEVCFKIPFWKL